jgi:hypothetical protein
MMSKDLATAFCDAQSRAERAEARVKELEAALKRIASPQSDRDLPIVLREIARAALGKGE